MTPAATGFASFEEAIDQLEAEVRAFRDDRQGHVAAGMRLWKRGTPAGGVWPRKAADLSGRSRQRAATWPRPPGRSLLIWAGKAPADLPRTCALRVEDGFLRSRGLGAELVPPLCLVTDDLGIYYDPTRESRLERLIRRPCPPAGATGPSDLLRALVDAAGQRNTT